MDDVNGSVNDTQTGENQPQDQNTDFIFGCQRISRMIVNNQQNGRYQDQNDRQNGGRYSQSVRQFDLIVHFVWIR